MSEGDFLETLLDGAEVEWLPLGLVVDTVTAPAKLKRKEYRETGKTPIIDQGIGFIAGYADGSVKAVPKGEYILFGDHSEHIKYTDFSFIQGADGLKILRQSRHNTKYIYYSFLNFYRKELSYKRHWSKAKVTLIPIPCPENPEKSLVIQAEIVRILDTFTELTTELTIELTARKKQYNYYRDQLLTFEESEVEWKTLGETAIFRRGTAITKKQTTPGNIPVVANGPAPTYFHGEENRKGETVVIARSGAYAGYVSFWNQPIFLTDAFSVHPNPDILKPKFLFHLLQNKQDHIHAMKKGAGVPHVQVKKFESYLVPIPSLAEQGRIVAILDKFDKLTHSISEGLPREIELRQKQYEYYRDLLLNFPTSAPRTEKVG